MVLSSKNRIRDRKEFNDILKTGRTARGGFLFIKFRPSDLQLSRFGIVVPAKIYRKASHRNRIKRILSEEIRKNMKIFRGGWNYIILVKNRAEEKDLIVDFISILKNIKL